VAVYVGTLHDSRIDTDLVAELARREPSLSIALVGPNSLSRRSFAELSVLPNVHLLGPRPYADVPGYLQHADVLVVPHRVDAFTESLDPIKAYECLAVGRPVVATPVAGFRELGGPVSVADRGSFVEAVREVLAGEPAVGDERSVPSWDERIEAFATVLERLSDSV
jgi:glycosyltransferase involved in cell wall biosynthesis